MSHCDFFAHYFVDMASLRGAWDGRALSQSVARVFLADLGMEGHQLYCCKGQRIFTLSHDLGLMKVVFGNSLKTLFLNKVKSETCS